MPPTSDLARWRADTPGCAERIHLNNAGAALQPRPVLEAVRAHLQRESEVGGYEAADEAAETIQQTYDAVARLVGCAPRNIAVVENATVAFAQALTAFDFRPGDVVVTSRADYVSNQLMYLSLARRLGVEVRRAADLPEGGVDPESVRAQLAGGRVRLVAVTWIPTNSGLVQAARAVGAVCAAAGVPYLVDACQAVGQLPIAVHDLDCDYLAATARKFLRGPRGIGFLYVSDRALARGDHPLLVDMRGAEWTAADGYRLFDGARRFENWEFSHALVLGLGAATQYAEQVGAVGYERPRSLAASLRERLATIPGVRVMDRGTARGAIVTVATNGVHPEELKRRLRARDINTSVSSRDDAVIDMDAKGVPAVLRFSPHYYNTEDELDAAAAALGEELGRSV
ncbi:MAG TPA: aminotransferase class V-fold PLP-dependent enzyme [Gemmatimonadales bacterium]|nr:aminotransferase class V-fold PLP-dependent enzyme [Gemmatimonadales bacterium]